jgi:hypothetical protein
MELGCMIVRGYRGRDHDLEDRELW